MEQLELHSCRFPPDESAFTVCSHFSASILELCEVFLVFFANVREL